MTSTTPRNSTFRSPYVVVVGWRHLYIGGDFTKVNGEPQPGFVKFPASG